MLSHQKITLIRQLTRYHPFECPAYVLETKLQDGKKLHKWAPKSHQCVYLGKSRMHSPSVILILNTKTDHISPQYHVVMDTKFDTVQSKQTNKLSLIKKLPVKFTKESLGDTFQANFDMDVLDDITDISDEILNTNNNQPSILPYPTLPSTHPLNSHEFNSQQEDLQPSEGDYVKTISADCLLLSEGDNQRKINRTSKDNPVSTFSLIQKEKNTKLL